MLPLVQNEEQHLEQLPLQTQGSLSYPEAKFKAVQLCSCGAGFHLQHSHKERHACSPRQGPFLQPGRCGEARSEGNIRSNENRYELFQLEQSVGDETPLSLKPSWNWSNCSNNHVGAIGTVPEARTCAQVSSVHLN